MTDDDKSWLKHFEPPEGDEPMPKLKPCPFCGSAPVVREPWVQCDAHTKPLNVDDWDDQWLECKVPRAEVDATEREERLEEALQRIAQWSDAYPPDIFLPPDLEKCRALLEAGGQTLDGVSGAAMRHVVTGVGKIAKDALDMNNSRSEG